LSARQTIFSLYSDRSNHNGDKSGAKNAYREKCEARRFQSINAAWPIQKNAIKQTPWARSGKPDE